MNKLSSTKAELLTEIPPHDIVGVIKFDIPRNEFLQLVKTNLKKMIEIEMPFEYDKIFVVCTYKGVVYNEIRFVKFKKDNKYI